MGCTEIYLDNEFAMCPSHFHISYHDYNIISNIDVN